MRSSILIPQKIEAALSQSRCLVIAEVAQAHDGSVGAAHAYIDLAAKVGADVIKFQTHIASAESTAQEQWRVKFSKQDVSRYDYWKRMEFTPEVWTGLAQHAQEKGLLFMSSPFSIEAVELLETLDMPAYKIASGELGNLPMLERIHQTGKPMIISSGMSDLAQLDEVVDGAKMAGSQIAVLQCTSAYPTPPEKVGLNVMGIFRERYRCAVGISDHSGTMFPSLAGVSHGASILEVHITLSKDAFGPDVIASLNGEEFSQMVSGVRYIETMMKNPIQKNEAAQAMSGMRDLFGKSIVAAESIIAGTIISREHLGYKKPGTGWPAKEYKQILGKKLLISVSKDHFFQHSDLQTIN